MKAVFTKQDDEWFFAGAAEDTTDIENSAVDRGLETKIFDLDADPTP